MSRAIEGFTIIRQLVFPQVIGPDAVSNLVGDLLLSVFVLTALYALIGAGFSLSFNIGRFFDLSLGGAFLAAGYAAYTVITLTQWPLPVAMLLGVVTAGLIGAAIGLWFVVPLSRRVGSLSLFVATLAVLYLAQAVAGILFGEGAQVLRSGAAPTATLGPFHITDIQAAQVLVATVVLTSVLLIIRWSRWGRYARAVADDHELAGRYGIPVTGTLLRCYVMAGLLAGIAGVFYAADKALDPAQAMGILLAAMVATIVGGESVGGALSGALLLAVLETGFGFAMAGNWKTPVAFTVLVIFLAMRGSGAVVLVNRKL